MSKYKIITLLIALSINIVINCDFVYSKQITSAIWLDGQGSGQRKIYWNRSYPSETITPFQLPQFTPSSNFGVSLPVETGDIIKVTFTGNFLGQGYISAWAYWTGPCNSLTANGVLLGAHDQNVAWRPFIQENLFCATADGTVSFKQSMYYSDFHTAKSYPTQTIYDYPFELFDRMVVAEIIGQADKRGSQWR